MQTPPAGVQPGNPFSDSPLRREASAWSSEAEVVATFCAWLQREGWTVERDVNWLDVRATKDGQTICAEAKGATQATGVDADTMYGQLLRRMTNPGWDLRGGGPRRRGTGRCPACRRLGACSPAGMVGATFTSTHYTTLTDPIDATIAMPSGY